jgi:hypothetical protein
MYSGKLVFSQVMELISRKAEMEIPFVTEVFSENIIKVRRLTN